MKKQIVNLIATGAILGSMASSFMSCDGGGTVTYGFYQSPTMTASNFVDALNDYDNADPLNESTLELTNTIRELLAGEDDWFVIWDAEYAEYKAFSLDELRTVQYYSFYSNNYYGTAGSWRDMETNDILAGDINGDGVLYETVQEVWAGGTFLWFDGDVSPHVYNDGQQTKDVAMMTGEAQTKKFIKRAAGLSYSEQIPFPVAKAMVSASFLTEQMIADGNLDKNEALKLFKGISEVTKVPAQQLLDSMTDEEAQKKTISDAARNLKLSSNKITGLLPMLGGNSLK